MILVNEYVKWSPKKECWAYEAKPNTLYYESLMLTIAGIVNVFGITLLMTPVKLYDSGIFGTSMLLEQVSPSYLLLSLFLLILNIPLFLIGLKKQGKKIYLLCYIYCFYIFLIRIADCGCFTNRCKYCFTISRYGFITLCTIWWYDFRYRKP